MQQLADMLEASDAVMRHTVMKGKAVSTRYKVRAMSDSMPTMKHAWDRVQDDNAYHYMYGDHIDGGKCSYRSWAQETMQHIYGQCKHTKAVRVKAAQKASRLWGKAQRHEEARLLEIDYFTQQGATMVGGGWQQWWRWMGPVSKEVRDKVELGEVKLVLATANILAKAGRDIWDARNEEQQRWELALGITQRKDEARKMEAGSVREGSGAAQEGARGTERQVPHEAGRGGEGEGEEASGDGEGGGTGG